MRILVTGGAGFIGSHLVDRLVRDRVGQVIVLDNLSTGGLERLEQSLGHIQMIQGDVRNRALLDEIMPGIDLVFHLAAQANVLGATQDLDYSFETNVVGTYALLRAARSARVRRVVFSSSREVYGEPTILPVPETAPLAPKNAYGASKAAAEMYCRSFADLGIEVLVFRLANVYGTRDHARVIPLFIERAMHGDPLVLRGSAKVLDFIWIDYVIDVLASAACCAHPGTSVNVGSGKGTTLRELAARIAELSGNNVLIQETQNRWEEVTRFIADTSVANRIFLLPRIDDPLAQLPIMVNHFKLDHQACEASA